MKSINTYINGSGANPSVNLNILLPGRRPRLRAAAAPRPARGRGARRRQASAATERERERERERNICVFDTMVRHLRRESPSTPSSIDYSSGPASVEPRAPQRLSAEKPCGSFSCIPRRRKKGAARHPSHRPRKHCKTQPQAPHCVLSSSGEPLLRKVNTSLLHATGRGAPRSAPKGDHLVAARSVPQD